MSKVESEIQREILTLIKFHQNGAKYSELKVEGIENDLFNYHLQQLVKNGFLAKEKNLYKLTEQGKSLVTNIDEIDKALPPNYKVSVYMCAVIHNKVLLTRRLKHPQYGYVGLPSGKIKYGERILDTAKREFEEETGLFADFKVIGNLRQIRRNRVGQMVEDGIFFVCYTDYVKGNLTEKSLEGEYFWEDIKTAINIEKIFKPSVEILLKEVEKRLVGETSWDTKFMYELEPEPEEY